MSRTKGGQSVEQEQEQKNELREQGDGVAADNLLDRLVAEAEAAEREAQARDEGIAVDVEARAEQEAAEKQKNELKEQGYVQGAAMAVSFMSTIVEAQLPMVTLDDKVKGQVEEKLVPVLRKYEGGMPPWLIPYKSEIELGMVLAGAGFGVWKQVKVHQYMEAQAQAQADRGRQAGRGAVVQGAAPRVAERAEEPKVPAESLRPAGDPLDLTAVGD